jgi:hypothetical protein
MVDFSKNRSFLTKKATKRPQESVKFNSFLACFEVKPLKNNHFSTTF